MRCGQVHYYKVLNCCVAIGNICCFSDICLCSQGNLISMWFTFLFYSLNNIHSGVSFLTIGFSLCTPFLYSCIIAIVLN